MFDELIGIFGGAVDPNEAGEGEGRYFDLFRRRVPVGNRLWEWHRESWTRHH